MPRKLTTVVVNKPEKEERAGAFVMSEEKVGQRNDVMDSSNPKQFNRAFYQKAVRSKRQKAFVSPLDDRSVAVLNALYLRYVNAEQRSARNELREHFAFRLWHLHNAIEFTLDDGTIARIVSHPNPPPAWGRTGEAHTPATLTVKFVTP